MAKRPRKKLPKPVAQRRRRRNASRTAPTPHVEGEDRLQKVLAAAGVASRRDCEQLILDGRVEIDRKVVTELGTPRRSPQARSPRRRRSHPRGQASLLRGPQAGRRRLHGPRSLGPAARHRHAAARRAADLLRRPTRHVERRADPGHQRRRAGQWAHASEARRREDLPRSSRGKPGRRGAEKASQRHASGRRFCAGQACPHQEPQEERHDPRDGARRRPQPRNSPAAGADRAQGAAADADRRRPGAAGRSAGGLGAAAHQARGRRAAPRRHLRPAQEDRFQSRLRFARASLQTARKETGRSADPRSQWR